MLKIDRSLNKTNRLFLYVASTLLLIVAVFGIVRQETTQANAANTANFDATRIIDDAVFYNSSAMSVSAIQSFLNSEVPTCDSNHAGFTGSTGTVYSPQFICLKNFYENPSSTYTVSFTYQDTSGATQTGTRTYNYNNAYQYTALCPVYVGGGTTCNSGNYSQGLDHLIATIQPVNGVVPSGAISAAQIIYNAAQQYGINPQVLIVLLQKEQGLVTDTWPASYEYEAAAGYGCPDYQPCSTSYAGFSNQVSNAAWQFQQYKLHPTNYSYQAGRNNTILWSPVSGCGSSVVDIQNQATAGLYNYTPYRPDQAALNAGYGTGDTCSSYGNRNFWEYFTDWFGSTWTIPPSNATMTNGLYRLNVPSSKSLDISGAGTSNGTNVQIWSQNSSGAQYWQVTNLNNGFYSLQNPLSGKYLDVSGAGITTGTNVQIWSGDGTCAQQWAIMTNGSGYSLISACSGLALDVSGSATTTDGANVQIWTPDSADGQNWQFTRLDIADGTYRITVPSSKSLDITGGATTDGTPIQIWDQNTTGAQYWQVTNLNNGYVTLRNPLSNKYLDVSGAGVSSGTPVQIWDPTGSCAQGWKIMPNGNGYYLISGCSGLVLDTSGSATTTNGAHVQIWTANTSDGQKWQFTSV